MLNQALALARQLNMLPDPGGLALAAVSGGRDSVCLLHWLAALGRDQGFRVAAAHFNHRLRGQESERDAAFVRALTARLVEEGYPVSFHLGTADVAAAARAERRGIEETARRLRYRFFEHTAGALGAQVIATGHTADDNAETLLLHLLRGAGSRGLGGIPPRRGRIVRPLLTTERGEIEAYLSAHGLSWVEDSSNQDDTFTRNRLRRRLMPALLEFNPALIPRLGETAAILREEDAYLDHLARQALAPAVTEGSGAISLPAAVFSDLPAALAPRCAQLLAARVLPGAALTAAQRRSLLALAASPRPSGVLRLPGGLIVQREYEQLRLSAGQTPQEARPAPLPLPGESRMGEFLVRAEETVYADQRQEPMAFWLDWEQTRSGILLRPRREGDRLTRHGRSKSVKKRMIDEKIPRTLRERLPALDCGGRLAAVAGLGPDDAFLPRTQGRAILVTIIPEP